MKPQHYTILLADDCDEDIFFYQHALRKGGIQNPIQVVHDGEEVIDYLTGARKFADRRNFPIPQLLLLDIKMPKMSGFEVLDWIRSNDYFKRLPVIMISSSKLQVDINRAHDLGANAYLVKPSTVAELTDTLRSISDFWIHQAEEPEIKLGST